MKYITKVWILLSFVIAGVLIAYGGWLLNNKLIILGGGIVYLCSLFEAFKLISDEENKWDKHFDQLSYNKN